MLVHLTDLLQRSYFVNIFPQQQFLLQVEDAHNQIVATIPDNS